MNETALSNQAWVVCPVSSVTLKTACWLQEEMAVSQALTSVYTKAPSGVILAEPVEQATISLTLSPEW